jgi:hypothetical protein
MISSMPATLAQLAALVTAVLSLTAPDAARADGPSRCQGTLSGDVKARFACSVVLGTQASGEHVFVISTPGPVEGIPSLVPGGFVFPLPVKPGTYGLAELGVGKASVAVEGGALYTATKTSGQRGDVTLTLRSVKQSPRIPGGFEVRGTYRARLVPVGGGRGGEVVVDVKF